jgi:hypothetical protein
MTTLFNKRRLFVLVLTFGALALSPLLIESYAQNVGNCVLDPSSQKCVVQGGGAKCAVGSGTGSCGVGENGCWCFLPNYTLTVAGFIPSPVTSGNQASSQITVTPLQGAGTLGSVRLSCTDPFKTVPWTATVTSAGAPANSTMNVTPLISNPTKTYTITCTAADDGPSSGPVNGPQSVTLSVHNNGGGDIAVLTFGGLLIVWLAPGVRRRKRALLL